MKDPKICRNLVFIGVGLLSVLGITKAPTAKADFLLDRQSAIADSAPLIQSEGVDLEDTQTLEQRNKEIVRQYFDGWQNGTGNFFDLLAPNAVWTITGSGAMVGTYQKQELVDEVIVPFNARLSAPIVPTVRGIWADEHMVIALWDGEATTNDGQPYTNTYTWYFRMKEGSAIEVIAFLDMQKFTDVWNEVAPQD